MEKTIFKKIGEEIKAPEKGLIEKVCDMWLVGACILTASELIVLLIINI